MLLAVVAPHAGAWIEIINLTVQTSSGRRSHPTRVRGLKYLRIQ